MTNKEGTMKSITTHRWSSQFPKVSPFRKGAAKKPPVFIPVKSKKS
jgi:hypothetical protein